jgi:hypothetical protein
MIPVCQPLPQTVAEEMLQVVARALCDRPGDSAAQRDSRTSQMVHTTLGFAPRDGLEYMLSTLAVGHFHLILDSMHDVFHGQLDLMKAKTKAGIVALDRAMIELLKELRIGRNRPVARSVEDARRQDPAEADPPCAAPQLSELEMPSGMATPPPAGSVTRMANAGVAAAAYPAGRPTKAIATPEFRPGVPGPKEAVPVTSPRATPGLPNDGVKMPVVINAGLTNAGPEKARPAKVGLTTAGLTDAGPARAGQSQTDDRAADHSSVSVGGRQPPGALTNRSNPPASSEAYEGTIEQHVAAFQAALAAAHETLAEARALDNVIQTDEILASSAQARSRHDLG